MRYTKLELVKLAENCVDKCEDQHKSVLTWLDVNLINLHSCLKAPIMMVLSSIEFVNEICLPENLKEYLSSVKNS